MKDSPHPPLSVADESVTGDQLAGAFSAQHREVYELIRCWQSRSRSETRIEPSTVYRAKIVDADGWIWPLAVREGPTLPHRMRDRLPPLIPETAREVLVTRPTGPPADRDEWTSAAGVRVLQVDGAPYCGGAPSTNEPGAPEWIPVASLFARAAADDAIEAHRVAEALGVLHEAGRIQTRHENRRFYVRLTPQALREIAGMSTLPPTLAEIGAGRQRFAQAQETGFAEAVAEEARLLGLGAVDPRTLAWIDQIPMEGETAAAAYAREGEVLPVDNLWALHPLPPSADPDVGRPAEERETVLLVLDRELASISQGGPVAWGRADPLQRLDRRLDAAAALLGMSRLELERGLRYNLLARWLLDYPLGVTPVQNGMGALAPMRTDPGALERAAAMLRTHLGR